MSRKPVSARLDELKLITKLAGQAHRKAERLLIGRTVRITHGEYATRNAVILGITCVSPNKITFLIKVPRVGRTLLKTASTVEWID